MIILSIETSCDETAVSLIEIKSGKNGEIFNILSNEVFSQIKIHQKYGGVVPEVAARAHLEKIMFVLENALKPIKNDFRKIDLIAATQGPGLITSLLVGWQAAKTLSWFYKKPLVPVNHLAGHICAGWLNKGLTPTLRSPDVKSGQESRGSDRNPDGTVGECVGEFRINFPLLAMIVSGGHTELVLMKNHDQYKILGQTVDDAAGECFDKVAKILNIGYPGGPAISMEAAKLHAPSSKLSAQGGSASGGQVSRSKFHVNLPRPMIKSDDLNFSFAGLKTAVLYKWNELNYGAQYKKLNKKEIKKTVHVSGTENLIPFFCYETQQAIIDVLIAKTLKAAKLFQPKTIILCGGVAANKELRQQMTGAILKNFPYIKFIIPCFEFCTDNAAMIAAAGYFKYQKMNAKQRTKLKLNWQTVEPDPQLELQSYL